MVMPGARENPVRRPRDAATLILLRRRDGRVEVLMGVRHRRHVFMPNQYVFPGGSVDPGDSRVVPATPLRADVAARLARACTPARARALAVAAVRETFEETGLMVAARAASPQLGSIREPWPAFTARGLAPALDRLEYLMRAITPPGRPRRFNTRFFVAHASAALGELAGNGELEDLHWVAIDRALALPIPQITECALRLVRERQAAPPAVGTHEPVPLHRQRHGRYETVEE
jgi:8-oxo-dGTP pyrophosphatase MutT (NUDIX family)